MATRKREKRTERLAPPSTAPDDETAGKVLARHQQMESVRGNFNTLWQSVAERVRPNQADFTTKWAEGQRRTNRVFDDTAPMACENGVAALESLLCPSSRQWHGLKARDKDLQGKLIVRQWLEQVTDTLFGARYSPEANFQSQIHETLGDIMTFGNGPFLVDDIVGIGIRYRSLPLAYTFGLEHAAGMIDCIHREWSMTPFAVMDAFKKGIIDEVPDQIADEYAQKQNSEKTWDFIHAICPRDESYDAGGKPISSLIVCKQTQQTVKRGGYYTQPIFIPRYRVNSRETYGRGPGVDVLPTILQLNEMEKADIRITQRAADPPYLTVDDINLPAFNLRSNSINSGYLTPDGKELIRPLPSGSKFEVMDKKLEMKQATVRRAFLNDIISILSEHPDMTATQVLQLAQERGYLVAPIIGRIQNELMGPVITRELDILHRAGQLPDPPEIVRQSRRFNFDIEYTSFSQTAQKQSKALAINMTLQQASTLFQANPQLMTKMINLPRTFEALAESNDAPPSILNTPEEQDAMDQATIQQQQLTNMATIAGPASQAIKNLSDASKGTQAITPGGG